MRVRLASVEIASVKLTSIKLASVCGYLAVNLWVYLPFKLNLEPNRDLSGTIKSETHQQEFEFTQCFEESDRAQLQGATQSIAKRDETKPLQMAQQRISFNLRV